ncbi:hypothetical protein D3C72_2279580 [compost metagenome]
MSSIERAPIASDGSLGAFSSQALALPAPRMWASSVLAGDRLFVVGGSANGSSEVTSVYSARVE